MKKIVLSLLTVFAVVAACYADGVDKCDGRIKYLLDKNELSYKINDKGNFTVVIEYDDDRSQQIFISSSTEFVDDEEIREIYSFAADTEDISFETAKKMLVANSRTKIGAWETTSDCDECIFTAKIPANASYKYLHKIIVTVGSVADDFEKEACDGRDDY